MADDNTTPAPEQAPAAPTAPSAPVFEFVALHDVIHDGVLYVKGDIFKTADKALAEGLRASKAIAYATEVQAADDVATRIADLEQRLAEATAQLEAQRVADASKAAKGSAK